MNTQLNDVVEQIRQKHPGFSVPNFDSLNGNENANFLFLLEAPGRKAVESKIVSLDNPDLTASNLAKQLFEADIDRSEIALWNIVPWYIGDENKTKIRAATRRDIDDGMRYLLDVIQIMKKLQVIVLVGKAAAHAHIFLSKSTKVRVVCCHHPSPRNMNSNPQANRENVEVFSFIKKTLA